MFQNIITIVSEAADMANIERMQDFSEVVHYENPDIPLYIRTSNLSIYPDMSAPCHWHDDIE